MAWPDNLDAVTVVGFKREMLPLLKHEMETAPGLFAWEQASGFADYCKCTFYWRGGEFSLEEMTEWVTCVTCHKQPTLFSDLSRGAYAHPVVEPTFDELLEQAFPQ